VDAARRWPSIRISYLHVYYSTGAASTGLLRWEAGSKKTKEKQRKREAGRGPEHEAPPRLQEEAERRKLCLFSGLEVPSD